MNKTFKTYAVLFIIIMVILALIEANKKTITDWRKNFSINEKTPFGLYVFNQEADHLFNKKLEKINASPFSYYSESKCEPHNILIIENDMDNESWKKIMTEVSRGSDALVVSDIFSDVLSDSLGIINNDVAFEDINVIKLTDKKFQNHYVKVDKFPSRKGFSRIKLQSEILGKTIEKDNNEQVNFIKIKFGKGNFYLHSEPLFITNYYLLKPGNKRYAEDVFSYLQNRKTIWFIGNNEKNSISPMRLILSKQALRYAWWLFLGGMLLFILFNAKRKQRVVPIVEPLKNTSVEFVKSIGNLYLQEGDFHDMMAKKAQYFLHKVRLDLLIDTKNLDEDFIKKLHLKTGKSVEIIREAVELMIKAQDPYSSVMREDLITMNKLLDEILKS